MRRYYDVEAVPVGADKAALLVDDGLEDHDGISLSGLVKATPTGGDTVSTFLVYLTRPSDDDAPSLQEYLNDTWFDRGG